MFSTVIKNYFMILIFVYIKNIDGSIRQLFYFENFASWLISNYSS